MRLYSINIENLNSDIPKLKCGDKVLLTGTVYTARDAAHKRIVSLIKDGQPLPFELKNAVIYYAGPTPTPPNAAIGSCGPTTSKRMDGFAPLLYENGMTASIGKGERNDAVRNAIIKNGGIYFCATGGAGALLSSKIVSCEIIAFEELGCEAVRKLSVKDFPVTVAIDVFGNSIFEK